MRISCRRFAQTVIDWAERHPRSMPWLDTKDPYKIWISEIILQQTRVSQGVPYYQEFIRRFPTVRQLANASMDQVLRQWQGLGYNARARHLHEAAREIMRTHKGVFPETYEEIRALKGVGDYTASAIASFAYGVSAPVLDSNVIRVLSRVYAIAGDPSKRETRVLFYDLLKKMIRNADPAQFNQAMMNFGALQCTPRNPRCSSCTLSPHCIAYHEGLTDILPVRKKTIRRIRYFHYFLIHDGRRLILHQRTDKDIWQMMYDFPMIEARTSRISTSSKHELLLKQLGLDEPLHIKRITALTQSLTHQEIRAVFYLSVMGSPLRGKLPANYRFVPFEKLGMFAVPKLISSFLSDNSLHLLKLPSGIKV